MSWPQNAPHRVLNGPDLNVSLSTEHMTAESLRRSHVYQANRLLRERFKLPCRSVRVDGLRARAKVGALAALRGMGLYRKPRRPADLSVATFRVDPSAAGGFVSIEPRSSLE